MIGLSVFASAAQLWHMQGEGVYVWSAYALALGALVALWLGVWLERRLTIARIRRWQQRMRMPS